MKPCGQRFVLAVSQVKRNSGNQVIAERDLNDCRITINPADPTAADRGTPITVQVTAPVESNSVFGLDFFSNNLEAVAVMNKE